MSVILETSCMGKLKLQLSGELCGVIEFLTSPKNSLHWRKLHQIYFTNSSNILNSLGNRQFFYRNCVWLRVAWHELNEFETECASSLINKVSLKKYSDRDSIKKCSLNILHEMRLGSHIPGSYPQKTRLGSLCKLCAMWIDASLDWLLF